MASGVYFPSMAKTCQGDAWARHLARRRSSHVIFLPWTYWFQSMGVPIGKMMINIDKASNFVEPLLFRERPWGNLGWKLVPYWEIWYSICALKENRSFVKPQCRAQFVKTNSSPLFEVVKKYWHLPCSNMAFKPRKKGNTQQWGTKTSTWVGHIVATNPHSLHVVFFACNSDRHWYKKGVKQWQKGLPPQPWKR